MSYPTTVNGYYTYLFRAFPWMQGSATRLGIPPAEISALEDLVGDDETEGTYFYDYFQYNAAPKRKDSLLVANLAESTLATQKKISKILDDTAASKWNNEDRLIFNRKKGLPRSYSKPESQIPFEIAVDNVPALNGLIDFKAKPRGETKRSHLAEGSNAIDMSYAFVQSDIRKATDLPGKVLEKCIGVDDCTNRTTFYKAIFQFTADSALIGFDLYCWFRFTNIHYPEFAGKWSEKHVIRIV